MGTNKEQFQNLNVDANDAYEKYKNTLADLTSEIDKLSDLYNSDIANINFQRMEIRKELQLLRNFLEPLGKMLNKECTIFDYKNEETAPRQSKPILERVEAPKYEEHDCFLRPDKWLKYHKINSKNAKKYAADLAARQLEYDGQLDEYRSYIKMLSTACKLSELYMITIIMVKDVVTEKIVPQTKYIMAFLYADIAREAVVENNFPSNLQLNSIVEYRGTRFDQHYQFVKNTFDFYEVLEKFFTDTVLTKILDDKVITEQEEADFKEGIEAVKQSIQQIKFLSEN